MIGPRAKGIRILVVDDEAPARQRLTDLLHKDSQVGAVLEAANGKAAVEIIERETLDLVFLDVQMPELDGLQVIETVGAAAMPLTVCQRRNKITAVCPVLWSKSAPVLWKSHTSAAAPEAARRTCVTKWAGCNCRQDQSKGYPPAPSTGAGTVEHPACLVSRRTDSTTR